MASPIYPVTGGATVHDGRFTVHGGRPGPAGTSAVTFPNGDIWQVDHVDQTRLVTIESDAEDPISSPLLLASIGGDALMFLIDSAGDPDAIPWDESNDGPSTNPRVRVVGGTTESPAGESVVLADLAEDRGLHPLARIAAAVELAVSLPEGPLESLWTPVATGVLERAEHLVDQFDDDDLDLIHAEDTAALQSLLHQLVAAHPLNVTWVRLADRLRANQDRSGLALVADAADALVLPDEALPSEPERSLHPIDEPHELRRIDEALVDVAVARADRQRWVRVFQRAGLVLLGQAPLRREGLVDKAEVVVPADLANEELAFEVIDAADLDAPPERQIDRVRAAITAGREATRADRTGTPHLSRPRWARCAELWELAGDHRRAALALRFAKTRSPWTGWQPVADQLAETMSGTA